MPNKFDHEENELEQLRMSKNKLVTFSQKQIEDFMYKLFMLSQRSDGKIIGKGAIWWEIDNPDEAKGEVRLCIKYREI